MPGNRVRPTNPFTEFKKKDTEGSIPTRFEQIVAQYPDRLAVKDKNQELTYQELNQETNRVAHAILERRGESEETVALLLDHDTPMIAAILGALKSKKTYLPMDPKTPISRARYILEDSKAVLIVTNSRNLSLARELAQNELSIIDMDSIDSGSPTKNPDVVISPDTHAWLLYTSGSTGEPKGVSQTHRNVLHFVMNYVSGYHISMTDRISLLWSVYVNAGSHEIFVALLNGASLFPFDVRTEGLSHLANWFAEQRLTVYCSAPTLFRHFSETLSGEKNFPDLRIIRLGGEPVYRTDFDLYKKNFSSECLFVNRLGSTETGSIRWHFMDKKSSVEGPLVPAGDAVPDNEILLWDDNQNEVAPGETGEIVVKSRYLSPGYWRKPELTQSAFLPDPEGGSKRIYRTGDLGRMSPDGILVHVGRNDHQVKVRGYRIEVAEIEIALLDLPSVKETVVLPRKEEKGDQQLVAYFVPSSEEPLTVSALRRELEKRLPAYMLPSAFVKMKSFPLAPNGKVHRGSLPAPGDERPELDAPFVSPRTPAEEELSQIWSEVLDMDQIGIHDPFLELGGDSLRATQVISRVLDHLQVEIPMQVLMESSTIAEMAETLLHHKVSQIGPDEMGRLLDKVETPPQTD